MKTTKTISIQEFLSEVKKLAEQIGQSYYSVYGEIKHQSGGKILYEFGCYIHTKTHECGSTPNEALQKMNDSINPPKPSIIKDVIIDLQGDEFDEYHSGAQQ